MDAPAVAVSNDGKKVAAAWMDMRAGKNDRDVQWTAGSGGKFAPEASAADVTTGTQGHPSLVFDKDGTAWCAWEDGRGGPNTLRIYAADSKTRKNLAVSDESEGKCGYPSLVSAAGFVAVAYESNGGVSFRIVPGN
jgi:beta-xylosidase